MSKFPNTGHEKSVKCTHFEWLNSVTKCRTPRKHSCLHKYNSEKLTYYVETRAQDYGDVLEGLWSKLKNFRHFSQLEHMHWTIIKQKIPVQFQSMWIKLEWNEIFTILACSKQRGKKRTKQQVDEENQPTTSKEVDWKQKYREARSNLDILQWQHDVLKDTYRKREEELKIENEYLQEEVDRLKEEIRRAKGCYYYICSVVVCRH